MIKKLWKKFIDLNKWIWAQLKDWKTFVLFLGVCAVYNLGVAVDATGKDDDVCPYNMGEDVGFDGGEE